MTEGKDILSRRYVSTRCHVWPASRHGESSHAHPVMPDVFPRVPDCILPRPPSRKTQEDCTTLYKNVVLVLIENTDGHKYAVHSASEQLDVVCKTL